MKRKLWSADKFDRKLAGLFESLEGREVELQGRLDRLVEGLLGGSVTQAPQHGPLQDYDVCCLPLIDRNVVVFHPDESTPIGFDETGVRNILDFSNATRFDLLNIEEEAE